VPNVANLKENYEREKLLNLLKHGNGIGPKLYIQENQELDDWRLLQAVVDLLATVDKPEKLVREVTIEPGCRKFEKIQKRLESGSTPVLASNKLKFDWTHDPNQKLYYHINCIKLYFLKTLSNGHQMCS
jgi:hypothetical protein